MALFQNFLEALPLADIKPKRIMLQTGAKNYGVHLGPTTTPQEEDHARITLEPNFYYPQEDFLWEFCRRYDIGWNIVMPSFIMGAVPDAAMNLVYPLGIYASVIAHLKSILEFPTDLKAWEATHVGSSSMLNAYLEEWATLTDGAKNEKFNAADSSPFTWGNFWAKLASWYNVPCGRPSLEMADYRTITTQYDPPPRGFGPPATLRVRFTLVSWARQPYIQKAWAELIDKYSLHAAHRLEDMDIDRVFAFADGSLLGGTLDLSMNKARKMGWHGFVDTNESMKQVLVDFKNLGMLPPLPE